MKSLGTGGARRANYDALIICEGNPVGVGKEVVITHQDQDSFDEAPQRTEAAGQNGDNDLDDPNVGVAEVEAMNTESPEKDPKQSGSKARFRYCT